MRAGLSQSQARRIALRAQGLAEARPTAPVTARAVGRTFARLHLVQIDSVNILSRSHFLPFFSRLGHYEPTLVTAMAGTAPRTMMEYWAHEASFIRPTHFPDLLLWQRRTWAGSDGLDPALRTSLDTQILALLAHSHPLTAREITRHIGHEEEVSREHWGWNWGAVKRCLEGLFQRGLVSAASRNEQFERRYALLHQVLPTAQVLPASELPADRQEALLRLVDAAAAAHGIGTVRCFADYFRLPAKPVGDAVVELVRRGRLDPVTVDGWERPCFVHATATVPRRAAGRALLSPFDSLVFERRRLQELFNMHFRLEMYTPAAQRRYGYYVLPFLLGENIVARVDLKADRAAGVLRVRGAFAEPDAPRETAPELAAELALMARWLGLAAVLVDDHGDLAHALARECAASHVD